MSNGTFKAQVIYIEDRDETTSLDGQMSLVASGQLLFLQLCFHCPSATMFLAPLFAMSLQDLSKGLQDVTFLTPQNTATQTPPTPCYGDIHTFLSCLFR